MYLSSKFKTPKDALDFLLKEGEVSLRGFTPIFQCYLSKNSSTKVGSFKPLNRSMLEGRNYVVEWVDNSVGVFFTDCIFFDEITGRSFPDKTNNVVVMFPNPGFL